MSPSSETHRATTTAFQRALDAAEIGPELDVRDADTHELVRAAKALHGALSKVDFHDHRLPDLVRRVYNIRQELTRRERQLPPGTMWTVTDAEIPTRVTWPAPFSAAQTRNGRGGPGGPGGWDD